MMTWRCRPTSVRAFPLEAIGGPADDDHRRQHQAERRPRRRRSPRPTRAGLSSEVHRPPQQMLCGRHQGQLFHGSPCRRLTAADDERIGCQVPALATTGAAPASRWTGRFSLLGRASSSSTVVESITDVPAQRMGRGWRATTIRSSSTPSWRRWRRRGASARRPGCVPRLVLARDARARWSARCRSTSRPTATASSSSTGRWANAAHRAGVRYYPKLVAAIPFTPATGRRLPLLAPGVDGAGGHRGAARGACARSPTTSAPRRCTSSSAPSREGARCGGARLLAAAEHAVPLAQPRRAPVRELRRLPVDVPLAQPQAGAQGARRRRRRTG